MSSKGYIVSTQVQGEKSNNAGPHCGEVRQEDMEEELKLSYVPYSADKHEQ